ncbi:DMT family transporter [Reinekea blandensis]|uniref:EamA domain-containing protein n=1 Tax=Reinekea blandensis MED297 TaxID=314283 RepID=A4BG74_9GAMM|nr:DMT family transporter [Reinekea blandensis]EAR08869.1 hypothetical protein MED297_04347 [Reinekea sp. MED297] [Reinekea blandensis MED297]
MLKLILITLLALIALAGNSVFARLALAGSDLDPASFTIIRLLAGALCLSTLLWLRSTQPGNTKGRWVSAAALFLYAAGFSFAYVSLDTGTGALILFGFVQLTMILAGLLKGQRLTALEIAGTLLAFAGLAYLMLPGAQSPSQSGFLLMAGAGISWGVYTLLGRQSSDAIGDTAWNFIRTLPMTLLLAVPFLNTLQWDTYGVWMAVASGALTSGLGYVLWYQVLRHLTMTLAGVLQLSVPLLAAVGGILFASEPITLGFVLASALILGGIGLVIAGRRAT